MNTKIILVLLVISLNYLNADFAFIQNIIKDKDIRLGTIAYGDARNDGVKRFYGIGAYWNDSQCIYEVTLTTYSYVKEIIDYDAESFGSTNIIIDDCREDGKKRLYVARCYRSLLEGIDGKLLEYEYIGGIWKKTKITTVTYGSLFFGISNTPSSVTGFSVTAFKGPAYTKIAIGDARGDGVKRLYFDGIEYTFFQSSSVGTSFSTGKTTILADARNDGKLRLYGGSEDDLLEAEWTGSGWKTTALPGNFSVTHSNIVIGPGRNDGVNRIYTKYVPLYEYLDEISWEDNRWVHRQYKIEEYGEMPLGVGFYKITGAVASNLTVTTVGDGRNDGVNRLYLVDGSPDVDVVVELTWNGNGWDRKDFPLKDKTFISGALFILTVTETPIKTSNFDNSTLSLRQGNSLAKVNKAYTSSGDEYIFAYPQPAYDPSKTQQDKLQPVNNYFKRGEGWASVWYYVDEPGNVNLKVYNIKGELVKILFDGWKDKGEYCEVWTGRNEAEDICGTGLYLINLVTPRGNITKKICIAK